MTAPALVVIESPLAAKPCVGALSWLPFVKRWVERRRFAANQRYARECMRDALRLGFAPYASHLLYAQRGILDDNAPAERELGIAAGFAWGACALTALVYVDLGISGGMRRGIERALAAGQRIEYRRFDGQRYSSRIHLAFACKHCDQAVFTHEYYNITGCCERCRQAGKAAA